MIKVVLTAFVLLSLCGCAALEARSGSGNFKVKEQNFQDIEACFIVYDLKSNKVIAERGGPICEQRAPACSTFKIPLALMAFDSNLIKDENTTFKWDGVKRGPSSWNRDQTASSWMKDSVVWVSQTITPKLGPEKIASYLKLFNYGNQDFSGGLTTAWLPTKNPTTGQSTATLQISPREQLEFMKGFWQQSFKISDNAFEKTKLITQLESLSHGYYLSGKTGSGYLGEKNDSRLGWFLGHIEGHGVELLTVLKFVDDDAQNLKHQAGPQAKAITLKILNDNGL